MARIVSVSADQSQISTDITNPAADGVAVTTVYVSAKQERDSDGEPYAVPGLAANKCVITVTSSTGVTITQPSAPSDEFGNFVGSFVSTNPATVSVGATVCGRTVTGNATVIVGGGAPVGEGLFFSDDFAGGVKTNDNGFVWNATTSRVTVQLAPDGSGDYALRHRFGPNADQVDSSAEQRFNMGQALSEVWIEYELWVPTNYVHREQVASSTNNKFFSIWDTTYSGSEWNCIWEYTRVSDSISAIRPTGNTEYRTVITSNSGTGWSNPDNEKQFIGGTGPITLGAWHQIRFHHKASSGNGALDGVAEMFVDGVLFAQVTGALCNFDNAGTTALTNGYFLGWANSGFTDETDFYIRGGANGPKFYNADPNW